MYTFLTKGLAETAAMWSDVEQGYAWVHRAAHLLSNNDKLSAAEVRQTYETLLTEMENISTPSEPLTMMLSTFRKVTASYWPGLFHCYDQADLPRTNNELEQYFGSARHHERRATGRKTERTESTARGSVYATSLPYLPRKLPCSSRRKTQQRKIIAVVFLIVRKSLQLTTLLD